MALADVPAVARSLVVDAGDPPERVALDPCPAMITGPDPALRRRVQAALSGLAPEYREIISLAYFDHLSIRQIAHRTGISIEAAHRRATDALLSFREALDKPGVT
jgi:RNA polymerase sigma-70 factor, ECF subfamily